MDAALTAADRARLEEAVLLGARGRFAVEPNPTVGCLLVRGERVVGRGWHRAYGGPHAEVAALRNAGPAARGATAYVSLEPCSTQGKTPPCTEALRRAGVARVVWAARDPDPAHGGRAAARLRAAGIAVSRPGQEPAARAALAPFRRALAAGRPWTILKWASTLDGRTAAGRGRGGAVSGPAATRFVHELRGRVEAVAVGVGTILADDPRLDCRRRGGPPEGRPQPLRVVFDSRLRTPPGARILAEASPERPVLFLTAHPPARRERGWAARAGVEVLRCPGRAGRVDLERGLASLHERGVRRLLVEGGARLAGALLRDGLLDQVAAILALSLYGATQAPSPLTGTGLTDLAQAPRLEAPRWRRLGRDLLVEGYVGGDLSAGRRS